MAELRKVDLKCAWCGKYFEGTYGVPQKYHTMKCAEEAEFWQKTDRQKRLRGEKSLHGQKVVSDGKPLNTEQKRTPTPPPIEKSAESMPEPHIEKMPSLTTKNESKGPEKTVNTLTEKPESNTPKTESNALQTFVPPASSATLPEVLSEQFLTSEAEKYHMTSLLDSSATALHLQMQGMFKNYPEPQEGIRTYEPEKVQTSVMCAREIVNILRLKLDIVKIYKGVK